jgi:hypothetical protein
MRPYWLAPLLAAALAAPFAPPALAQPARFHLGVGPAYTYPAGSLRRYLAGGYGVGAHLILGPDRRALRFRVEADFLWYPVATRSRPYRLGSPAIIGTGSSILTAIGGPRIGLTMGRVRLAAGAGAGIARLTNTGSVSVGTLPGLNRSTSFDDLTYAASGGGGAAFRLAGGRTPVWLDLSARYLWIGPSRWLREGNLPAGTISGVYLYPTWSVAAIWVYRAAIAVGLSH